MATEALHLTSQDPCLGFELTTLRTLGECCDRYAGAPHPVPPPLTRATNQLSHTLLESALTHTTTPSHTHN